MHCLAIAGFALAGLTPELSRRSVVEVKQWQAFFATVLPERSGVGLNELLDRATDAKLHAPVEPDPCPKVAA